MARHKVIADSEDEDEGDDVLLPHLEGDLARPEPEPLSPQEHRQPSSVATDPSFFARIYDNQRDLAVQQSHLIENIVRQSQRASAGSSGDVSLPSKKTGRRVAPSSGTDVTSPMILSRPQNHTTRYNEDASNFTTPRKSMAQVWDIPSSPDGAAAPRSAESTRGKEKTYGKAKKGQSRLASSPVPAEMSAAGETTLKPSLEDRGVDDPLEERKSPRTLRPAAKRTEVSHHDPTLPDTSKFYIAQSNLTTMQKLEYQRVNVSMNGYGGLPGSLPNYKSSGATTIPYSTPAGYSPVPPLPWEEPLAQPCPQENLAIYMSSSPDIIGNGFGSPNERSPVAALEAETSVPNRDYESPTRAKSRTPVAKGKKRTARDEEEDELGRNDTWDPDDIDAPQDSYKPRPTKRRAVLTAGFSDIGGKPDAFEHIAIPDTQEPPELPAPLEEAKPEAQLKKRGRKKKQPTQPTTETLVTEPNTNEEPDSNQNPVSPEKAAEAEAEASPEKPKKKRGRPRKSGPSKAAEEPGPEPPIADEPPITESPQKDDSPDTSAPVSRKQGNGEKKVKRKKSKVIEETDDEESNDDRPPLTEVDSNLRSPSKSESTKEETPALSRAGSTEEKPTPKTKPKEPPKAAASQSKPTYRVGLSKRSRIAPLLKIIRK